MVWQPGHELQGGKYIIQEVLGQGGFGITYKVQHTLFERTMVIKTPNQKLQYHSEYPKFVERFIKEGQKLAALSEQPHPNIVRVTDLFEDDGIHCLVMNFVAGRSLFDLVKKRGALSELQVVHYIRQIGEALIFVHEAGLVHRDAHPGETHLNYVDKMSY